MARVSPVRARPVSFLVSILAIVQLAGCGSAEYDSRMQARLEELWHAEAHRSHVHLNDLYDYIQPDYALAGGRVNLRVPEVFDVVHNEDSLEAGQPIDPRRLYPAGVRLPGYDRTYEEIAEVPDDPEQRAFRYFLYLGAERAAPGTLDGVAQQFLSELAPLVEEVPEEWETVTIDSTGTIDSAEGETAGEPRVWKRLRLSGDFFYEKIQNGAVVSWEKFPSVIELYMHEGGGHHVVIGSKVPKELIGVVHMREYLPLVASTVTIDDTDLPPLDAGEAPGRPDEGADPGTATTPVRPGLSSAERASPRDSRTEIADPAETAAGEPPSTAGPPVSRSPSAETAAVGGNNVTDGAASAAVTGDTLGPAAKISIKPTPGTITNDSPERLAFGGSRLAAAYEQLASGRGKQGVRLLQAAALAGSDAVEIQDHMGWSPGLRRPALLVRFAAGVVRTEEPVNKVSFMVDQNSHNALQFQSEVVRDTPRSRLNKMRSSRPERQEKIIELRRKTFGVSDELLLRLTMAYPAGGCGTMLSQLPLDNEKLAPEGIISLLGQVESKQALYKAAAAAGCDVLLVADWSYKKEQQKFQGPATTRPSTYFTEAEYTLIDVARGKPLWKTSLTAKQIDDRKQKEVERLEKTLLAQLDRLLMTALPDISAEQAAKRAAALAASEPRDPWQALCEIRLFAQLGLIDRETEAGSYAPLIGEAAARALASADQGQRSSAVLSLLKAKP